MPSTIIVNENLSFTNSHFYSTGSKLYESSTRENESISEDNTLMFDEIHIQQAEEYAGGEIFGCYGEGQFYKGISIMLHDCRFEKKLCNKFYKQFNKLS